MTTATVEQQAPTEDESGGMELCRLEPVGRLRTGDVPRLEPGRYAFVSSGGHIAMVVDVTRPLMGDEFADHMTEYFEAERESVLAQMRAGGVPHYTIGDDE